MGNKVNLPVYVHSSSLTDSQKRKREFNSKNHQDDVDTSKPTAVFRPTGGRSYTLSIALPGSIIAKYIQLRIFMRSVY
jgi:hypothetical protein